LTPGQAGDAPEFIPLFEASLERVPETEEVVADKGYDSLAIKMRILDEDMAAHIPSKVNALEPWPYDVDAYKERNRVERLINKLKQFRRVATRYDKLANSFLAFIKLALVLIKARSIVNRT
jgi:transposase